MRRLRPIYNYLRRYDHPMVILYADDDSEDREIFALILQEIDSGIKLIEAVNGIEAIYLLASDDLPDMIFLDVNMPVLNGDQTLIAIRKDPRLRGIKIVMYSTSIDLKSIPDYIVLNAEYLNKPASFPESVIALKNVIHQEFPSYVFN